MDPSGHGPSPLPLHKRPRLISVNAINRGTLGSEALKPAAEEALREWIVSSRVNRTGDGDDDPTLVEPVAAVG